MVTDGSDLSANADEITHIKCCLCAEENRKQEAEKYCIDCKDYYCSSCVGVHKKIPFMKGHQVLDKDDFKTLGPDGSLPSNPTQRCSEHETEVVTMFCEDHDEVACPQCIARIHRSCNKIISISEEIERLHRNIKPAEVRTKLRQMSVMLERIKTEREDKLKAIDLNLDKEISSVREFNNKLKELLDASEKETIQELRNKYDTIRSAVSDDIESIECLVKSVCESIEQFQKNEGNMSQEFVSVKCSEKLTLRAKQLETNLKRKPVTLCKFVPNQDFTDFLGRNTVLGNVLSCTESQEVISSTKDGLYTIKQKREINVKLPNDTNTCHIIGSCITEDGFLLLADYNNKKLKRVDLNRETVSDYIDLQHAPYAVCTVSRTEAAVTFYTFKDIVFVSLGNKMVATRALNMNHVCFGIAYRDNNLYISDYSKTVYVYDMNGRAIRNICKDTYGRDIFTCNQYVVVSGDGNKVYVTDHYNGFVVLDSQGNYLTTLTDSRIIGYRGVCTDGSNVFMSGYNSKDIVQISPDLKTLGVVGNDTNVLSLIFDHRKSRLVVSKYGSDMITILELN